MLSMFFGWLKKPFLCLDCLALCPARVSCSSVVGLVLLQEVWHLLHCNPPLARQTLPATQRVPVLINKTNDTTAMKR